MKKKILFRTVFFPMFVAFNTKSFGQKADAPSIRSAYLFADKGYGLIDAFNAVLSTPRN